MRIAWLEPTAGLTGDMLLGAIVGAGASLERIQDAVHTLGIGDVRVSYGRVRRGGEQAVSVRVRAPEETPRVARSTQVRALIQFAALDADVRARVMAVYDRLAAAQADAQGVEVEELEHNEFAMLDSVTEIVGVCVGLADLRVAQLHTGPITVGHGVIDGFDGPRAVPTPTVTRLLQDLPTVRLETTSEIVNSTGAAIVAALATPAAEPPAMRSVRVGTGAGPRERRDTGTLRLHVGHAVASSVSAGAPLEQGSGASPTSAPAATR